MPKLQVISHNSISNQKLRITNCQKVRSDQLDQYPRVSLSIGLTVLGMFTRTNCWDLSVYFSSTKTLQFVFFDRKKHLFWHFWKNFEFYNLLKQITRTFYRVMRQKCWKYAKIAKTAPAPWSGHYFISKCLLWCSEFPMDFKLVCPRIK